MSLHNHRTMAASAACKTCNPPEPDLATPDAEWVPLYEKWRHGGWYVTNIRYPSGAVGCVSRNNRDRKWRIVCDPRPFETAPTFLNRDAAAHAERALAQGAA